MSGQGKKHAELVDEPVIKEITEKTISAKQEMPIEQQIEKLELKLKEPTLAKEQRQKLEQQLEALFESWVEGGAEHA